MIKMLGTNDDTTRMKTTRMLMLNAMFLYHPKGKKENRDGLLLLFTDMIQDKPFSWDPDSL